MRSTRKHKNKATLILKSYSNKNLFVVFSKMVCVPCVLLPFLLFIWHKFLQPIVLTFWNPWKPVENKAASTSLMTENGENENNINKCLSGRNELLSTEAKEASLKKDE